MHGLVLYEIVGFPHVCAFSCGFSIAVVCQVDLELFKSVDFSENN